VKPGERFKAINSIAYHLQEQMTTTDINAYLGGFGVRNPGTTMARSKRVYVQELLADQSQEVIAEIAADLRLDAAGQASYSAGLLKVALDQQGLAQCAEDFGRALNEVARDPGTALGHASTTLESICKAVLDQHSVVYPRDESLQGLLKAATACLNLSPDGHADEEIKRILGGLTNAGVGLAVLRTKYSTFHGKGAKQRRLGGRHARLAINALAAVGLFIVETSVERFAEGQSAV
jgi:hypothetical protein